jgi:tryptophan 2,3-dioxygenase
MGSPEPFEQFRRLVLAEPELQAPLRTILDWPSFVAAAVELGARHGIVLDEAIVLAARDEARRTWRERWV